MYISQPIHENDHKTEEDGLLESIIDEEKSLSFEPSKQNDDMVEEMDHEQRLESIKDYQHKEEESLSPEPSKQNDDMVEEMDHEQRLFNDHHNESPEMMKMINDFVFNK
jgi:hypothetical protein